MMCIGVNTETVGKVGAFSPNLRLILKAKKVILPARTVITQTRPNRCGNVFLETTAWLMPDPYISV